MGRGGRVPPGSARPWWRRCSKVRGRHGVNIVEGSRHGNDVANIRGGPHLGGMHEPGSGERIKDGETVPRCEGTHQVGGGRAREGCRRYTRLVKQGRWPAWCSSQTAWNASLYSLSASLRTTTYDQIQPNFGRRRALFG